MAEVIDALDRMPDTATVGRPATWSWIAVRAALGAGPESAAQRS